MALARLNDADTAQIVATGDHDQVARVEFDVVLDLVRLQIEPDGVVDLDVRVRVADGAAVVRDQHGHALGSDQQLLDLAQLVLGLLGRDAVHGEAALDVVDESELLARLLDRDHVHEAGWVAHVRAHFAVYLDQTLRADLLGLRVGQRVLKSVAEKDDRWQALASFVRACAWLWCEYTRQFVQHPLFWRI